MATVELTNQQVLDLVRQLPPEKKRDALMALAGNAATDPDARLNSSEQRLRQLAQKRGLSWDAMSNDDREALVDDLIHEDRPCAP
jgi:hypothetical protein